MQTTRQGVRNLNGPKLDGKHYNGKKKQQKVLRPFCLHVDVRSNKRVTRCNSCGATWSEDDVLHPGDLG